MAGVVSSTEAPKIGPGAFPMSHGEGIMRRMQEIFVVRRQCAGLGRWGRFGSVSGFCVTHKWQRTSVATHTRTRLIIWQELGPCDLSDFFLNCVMFDGIVSNSK